MSHQSLNKTFAHSAEGPTADSIEIGKKLRHLRKENGYTQMRLGAELGVTFQQVQKYEKGTNRISANYLFDVARIFKVSSEYFNPQAEIQAALTPSSDVQELARIFASLPDASQKTIMTIARTTQPAFKGPSQG